MMHSTRLYNGLSLAWCVAYQCGDLFELKLSAVSFPAASCLNNEGMSGLFCRRVSNNVRSLPGAIQPIEL